MSEDVIADMKKTLFKMVNAIGDDRLPDKIEVKDKKVECSKVSRAEQEGRAEGGDLCQILYSKPAGQSS